jgi:DEAD/DEAH box helicase domain-containing protein
MFIASRNAIDQFYVENIDLFIDKPLDRLAVNLENEEILGPHAMCALFEAGGDKSIMNPFVLGDMLVDTASGLNPDLKLLEKVRPHRKVDLRSIFGQTYTIRARDDKEIGTISGDKLFSEVYIGAIYDHYGRSWRVTQHGANEVYVEPNDVFHHTRPTRFWYINVEDYRDGRRWVRDDLTLTAFFGRVEVNDTLVGYREVDERSGDVVDQVTYEAAQVKKYRTDAVWLEFEFGDGAPPDKHLTEVHSVEHAVRVMVPLAIPCDPFDLAGLTTKGSDGSPTFYIYDAVRGGIGISKAVFSDLPGLLRAARPVLADCDCKKKGSCPRCIQLSRCEHYNELLHRDDGIALLDRLLTLVETAPAQLNPLTLEWSAA